MFDSLIVFFYYLGPLWIYAVWKITQWLRLGVESLISVLILVGIGLFSSLEVSSLLGRSIAPYDSILGYWSFIWPVMFWIGLAILRYRKYYTFFRSIILSFLATVSAIAVWEIPIHVITIYLHPTLYQTILTIMLAYPTGIMIIPFRLETRYDITLQKPFNRRWKRYLRNVVIDPIGIGLALVALQLFNVNTGIFDLAGYPVPWFQMFLRIGYAGVFLEYLWRTPKSRIISRTVVE